MNDSNQGISESLTTDEALLMWFKTLNRAEGEPHYWNEWVNKNPVCDVTFRGVDFGLLRGQVPEGKISFSGFKFPVGRVSFVDAKFGRSGVKFNQADFGEGDVDFFGAEFEQGDVNFNGAIFGDGDVRFASTKFGDGNISFKNVKFGKGEVSFKGLQPFNKNSRKGSVLFDAADFNEGKVNFSFAEFGIGVVSFDESVFGTGTIDFNHTNFGEGAVIFIKTQFGDGYVNFQSTSFRNYRVQKEDKEKEGHVVFDGAVFGKGNVRFDNANIGCSGPSITLGKFKSVEELDYMNVLFRGTSFGEGDVSFSNTRFGNGKIDFENASFGDGDVFFMNTIFGCGHIQFLNNRISADFKFLPAKLPGPGSLDFRYCSFFGRFQLIRNDGGPVWGKPISFEGSNFSNVTEIRNVRFIDVPDFRSTANTHHLSMENIDYQLTPQQPTVQSLTPHEKNNNISYITLKLQRLKNLAEKDGNHYLALKFHADELRTRRWNQTKKFETIVDIIYDFLCDYGQTIWRPTFFLIICTIIFSLIYLLLSSKDLMEVSCYSYLLFSFTNSVPFLAISRDVRLYSLNNLFNENDITTGLYALLSAQGLISAILIFLIGLGIRNHFKIK